MEIITMFFFGRGKVTALLTRSANTFGRRQIPYIEIALPCAGLPRHMPLALFEMP